MISHLKYWATAASFLALAGCSSNKDTATDAPVPSASAGAKPPAPSRPINTAPQSPDAPAPAKADTTPLDAYVDSVTLPEPDLLTWLFVSRVTPALSDEEKLNLFAPDYFGQQDGFKKKDIAASELPRIDARLIEIAKISHLINDVPIAPASLNAYDFSNKSFQLQFCGPGQAFSFTDSHRTKMVLDVPSDLCTIPVVDENQAREIEGWRAKYNLDIKARAWFRIDGADPTTNTVHATATRMHLTLVRGTMKDHIDYATHKVAAPVLLEVDRP